MKKLLTLILCLGLATVAVGCQAKQEESTEWIAESAAKIDTEIGSGQFVLDGVVYEFPMDLQYWLDNGWHISNNYDNIDEFTLLPGESSSAFELFNEEDAYVRVSVLNTTQEEAKVEQCMVYSLYMSLTEVDVVFPQGMTTRNKPADVLAAYGEPLSKGDEAGLLEALYYFEDEDAWQCYVELDVIDNDYTLEPFASVEYYIASFDDYWDSLVEEEGVENACRIYFDAAMKASFWGDFADYNDYGIDSQSGAEGLYESEIYYYADFLMYYLGINADYVNDDIMNRFVQVAKDVLAKVNWNVKSVEVDVFDEGIITIELYPTNFLTIIDADITSAMEQFNQKYADVDFENLADEEYMAIEEDYALSMLDVLESKAGEAGTLDVVEKQYEIDLYETIITDEAWIEIDDIIMDVIESDDTTEEAETETEATSV